MSEGLDEARSLVAEGEYERAVSLLWRIEPNARTDLTQARAVLDLASACRGHASGSMQRYCEIVVANATASVARLSRLDADAEPRERSAVSEPAVPVQLARFPPIDERSSILVTGVQFGMHDVSIGGTAVARVSLTGRTLGFESALAESSEDRWRFECQRHGPGWRGVATSIGLNAAVAAYYPRWRTGGTLALEEHSYRLKFRPIRGGWTLRDDGNVTVAALGVPRSKPDSIEGFGIRIEPAFRAQPDFMLVLLLAIWAVLLERHMLSSGGGW